MVLLYEGKIYKEGVPEDFEKSDDTLIKSFFK
jgi:ABC-type transporter Mla maintaining outer membrane lipid asymmetry ATPase subunit MlaF